jgi:hypothetical protein
MQTYYYNQYMMEDERYLLSFVRFLRTYRQDNNLLVKNIVSIYVTRDAMRPHVNGALAHILFLAYQNKKKARVCLSSTKHQ